ncbi:MAG: hypothetical protein CL477_14620 [Acidobacteria bacterium]|jgi:AcrR family transcriptional regulator|nr:hypothetical protein [Acidobacteriota bacterium]MDP7337771.1 TetR/AcrR family transcriptional regulator [Vicinamibacterales bacterium]MDP7478677.1 TetR/AcrR family transcriptional regulator [Vicinamibacterales bacterium]MDP7692293.1 TetR/AcrR family transcriptional regulator [Vicinamibacterales bacterium]HJN43762.1 TetR/AcrR family transcriptional regulator [Vicinamibacterales bacterium]
MARTVDVTAHAQRRLSFLESAARLIERKGYEQMTVQDVLDDVEQSKGAFYHYFESKQALVEGLIAHLGASIVGELDRYMQAPSLSALDKLRALFDQGNRMKLERRQLWTALIPMWSHEGNAAIRQRVFATVQERLTPLLTGIIKQGCAEGVFTTRYPEQIGRMVFALSQDLNSSVVLLLTARRTDADTRAGIERAIDAYNDAVARLLGVSPESLMLVDRTQLTAWLDRSNQRTGRNVAPLAANG